MSKAHKVYRTLPSRHLMLWAILMVLPFSAVASDKGPQIEHWKTKNGGNVYFVAAPELPMVDVRIIFDAGSARDGNKGGLALLTNGLLAEGAGELDATAIAQRFEGLGAQFSNSSHRDMAIVELRSLSDPKYLDPALTTFNLLLTQPTFPEAVLERERKRLLIALQAQKEDLDDISDKAFFRAIYDQHPYAEPSLGTEQSLPQITRDDLVAFYKKFYVANNAVVAVVGALNRKQAEQLAETVLAGLSSGNAAPPLPDVAELANEEEVRINHPSQQTHLLVGQPGMYRGDPDYFPLYVGNHVFGGSGLVSRLAAEVREKRGLSYSQYSVFSPMRTKGPYIIGMQTRNDQAEQALTLVHELLRDFIKKGPTEEELDAAKKNITGSFPLRIAGNRQIVDYIAMIGFYGLPLTYLDDFNKQVDAVSAEQIRDAFQRRVNPDKLVTVIAGGTATSDKDDAP